MKRNLILMSTVFIAIIAGFSLTQISVSAKDENTNEKTIIERIQALEEENKALREALTVKDGSIVINGDLAIEGSCLVKTNLEFTKSFKMSGNEGIYIARESKFNLPYLNFGTGGITTRPSYRVMAEMDRYKHGFLFALLKHENIKGIVPEIHYWNDERSNDDNKFSDSYRVIGAFKAGITVPKLPQKK
tara:strand:+ start:55541 stop:56107 length:567 start_codon:yes stop_codon:yes gene_type:complete